MAYVSKKLRAGDNITHKGVRYLVVEQEDGTLWGVSNSLPLKFIEFKES